MREFIEERIASAIVGFMLGVFLALLLAAFGFAEFWAFLLALPVICGVICMAVGPRAVEAIKHALLGVD